jgi:4-amino-4-deoxy-L-arabinose transferase-like glycosyltransferase
MMQGCGARDLFLDSLWSIRRTCYLDIAVVAVLALVARLPWALIVHRGASSDSLFYVLGAKSIAAGHGYQILHHPTAFFPVGWPAFLAGVFLITGASFLAVKVTALVLWMLTTAFVYLLGRRLGGRSVGLVAGVLVAVAPTMTIYALRASSEHLFIPLLLAVCLLVVTADGRTPSMRRAALAGVFLGLAILVRSTGILLPLVIPLWLLLRRPARESWRAAVTMSVVSVLVLTPWMARNAVVMHTLGLSTNGGYTIWIGAHPGASGGFSNGGKHWAIRSVASETHQNSLLLHESIHYVAHNPLDWLGLIPAKFENLMVWQPGPLQVAHERHLHGAEATLVNGSLHHLWLFKLWHYSYWVLGGLALVLTTRRRLPGAGLAALLVGFWIVFHVTLVHGESRYMLSVTPLVAPALAWLLVAGARRVMALAERVRADRA